MAEQVVACTLFRDGAVVAVIGLAACTAIALSGVDAGVVWGIYGLALFAAMCGFGCMVADLLEPCSRHTKEARRG